MGSIIRISNSIIKSCSPSQTLGVEWTKFVSEHLMEWNRIQGLPLGSGVFFVNNEMELPEPEDIFHDAEQGPDEYYDIIESHDGSNQKETVDSIEGQYELQQFNFVEFWKIEINDLVEDLG